VLQERRGVGAPGRVIRTLSDEQIAMLRMSAAIYVKNAARFKAELKAI
jgi:carbonic anhydrase/acetyltransferase-like protein (isoleucine patch superfamily)